MDHYTCKGCGGVADEPKTCETETCRQKGDDLEECDCGDDTHGKDASSSSDIDGETSE